MMKKAFLATSIAILMLSISVFSASAQMTSPQDAEIQEARVAEDFINDVEHIASESQTYSDFVENLQEYCLNAENNNCTITQEFFAKILQFLTKERGVFIGGMSIYDLLAKFSSKFDSDYFVISYGVYNRLSPMKDNSIHIFKLGLSMWRYSDASSHFKGRSLILEWSPFGIHQKIVGPQLGFMTGFKGLYLDVESKITQNSYVMFIGRVDRIRVFELTSIS